jgi:hypothetical protein
MFHRILKERQKNEYITDLVKKKLDEKRGKQTSLKLIDNEKDPFWARFKEASNIYEEYDKLSKTVRERSIGIFIEFYMLWPLIILSFPYF